MMRKWVHRAITMALVISAAASCGDDGNPSQVDTTPPGASLLYVSFVGDTTKSLVSGNLTSMDILPQDLRGLHPDEGKGYNEAGLSWTQCPDEDFYSYLLYRSDSPGIEQQPDSALLVQAIGSVSQVSCIDNLSQSWGITYYYALKTVDEANLSSWSNEVVYDSPDPAFPEPCSLFVDSVGSDWVALSWTRAETDRFQYYIVSLCDTYDVLDWFYVWNQDSLSINMDQYMQPDSEYCAFQYIVDTNFRSSISNVVYFTTTR